MKESEVINKPLAEAPSSMKPSGIREVMALAAQIPDVIHMEVGEPSFNTPEFIKRAAFEATMAGFTRYTPSNGIVSVREAIVDKMRRVDKIETTVDNVVVTIGGVGAISSALIAMLNQGDEVMIPDPGWPNYESMILCSHAVPVRYQMKAEDCFVPNVQEMEKLITSKTKVIIINTPGNPTGAVFPGEVMRDIVEMVKRHGIYLISDEVYEELIFDGEHVSALTFDKENVIGCYSFSKTYAMTGWRVGYAVCNKDIAKLMTKIQESYVSCTAAVSQKAGEAALRGPQECVEEMRLAYKRRRDMAVEILQANNMFICRPNGAFYILADISSTGMDSYDFAKALIKEKKVALAPGATFGEVAKNMVRVSLATGDDDLREGMERMAQFVSEKSK
jgi:aspartate/methionine/tyrosine aminotransferase